MIRRALIAATIVLSVPTAAVAVPVVTVTAAAPAAVASADARNTDVLEKLTYCPAGKHLVGSTCVKNQRQLDTTTGTARKVTGWGWVLLGFASLGGMLAA